jgi:hypothetical protein
LMYKRDYTTTPSLEYSYTMLYKKQHEPWCINKTMQLHQVLRITTRFFMKKRHEPWCINETIQLHQVLSVTTRCFMNQQREPWCINETIQLHQVFLSSHLLECHIIYLLFRKAFCNSRLFLCRVRHRTFSEIYICLYLTNKPQEIFGFWILLPGREIYSLYHCFFCCVHWRHARFVVRVLLLLIQCSALCSVYSRLNGVSGIFWFYSVYLDICINTFNLRCDGSYFYVHIVQYCYGLISSSDTGVSPVNTFKTPFNARNIYLTLSKLSYLFATPLCNRWFLPPDLS